ncbi:hypothetical protein BGZ57DRAFT_978589 [Hyaloscypha finlandica]|nr:hypothetical protein BGZ57DRAFT_978589 [Hyaloscypha finlandica]
MTTLCNSTDIDGYALAPIPPTTFGVYDVDSSGRAIVTALFFAPSLARSPADLSRQQITSFACFCLEPSHSLLETIMALKVLVFSYCFKCLKLLCLGLNHMTSPLVFVAGQVNPVGLKEMGEMSWHLDPCNRLFPHHSPLAEQMRNKGGWHGNVQATGGSPLVEKSPHVAKSRRRKNIIEDGRQELVYEHDKVGPAAHALALCRILITPASLHALRFRENLLCLLGMGVNAPKAQTSKEPRRALHNFFGFAVLAEQDGCGSGFYQVTWAEYPMSPLNATDHEIPGRPSRMHRQDDPISLDLLETCPCLQRSGNSPATAMFPTRRNLVLMHARDCTAAPEGAHRSKLHFHVVLENTPEFIPRNTLIESGASFQSVCGLN